MAFNPLNLLKLKEKYRLFREEHPDMPPFGRALKQRALVKGTKFMLRATTQEGEIIEKEITLTENDVEIIRSFL